MDTTHDFFSQAKFQDTPTLTWCNEATSTIPPACSSQTTTDPETSSHSNRAPNLTKEGLQVKGYVSCPGSLSTAL